MLWNRENKLLHAWSLLFCKTTECSKFHVNINTGFGVMTIIVYKGLTRNSRIGYTIWVLLYTWDWRELEMAKLVQTSLIESYWMQKHVRVTTFTISKLFRKNQQGKFTLPLRLVWNRNFRFTNFLKFSETSSQGS